MSTHKLAPVEPTPEMLEAGADWCGQGLGTDEAKGRAAMAYKSMLAAAPAVQVEPVAWMHSDPGRVDVIHDKVRKLLKDSSDNAGYLHRPLDKSERYTIPLYTAPQPAVQGEALADRMRAAGMMTIDEMMNKTPLDGFIRHAGVHDLDSYGQWLDMKRRNFLTMQAKRELNKDPEDDMYEWVIAHAAAFQEAWINFKAARPEKTEQQPIRHDWDDQDKRRRCGDRDWYASATCTPKQHPDDDAVDRFAAAMKAKLAKKRQEGRGGWQSMASEQLSALLHEHTRKGDPVDVANLAMMLHQNGQRIEQQQPTEPVGWQFYEDGKWWNGDDRIKDHRKNTEAAGMPVRDVYADPQPAPDVAELVDALRAMIDQAQRVSVCGNFSGAVVVRAIDALAAYRQQGGES